jgi:succinate dehydrogenase flavin-adding protein (antitoxin of CptAB toxin-antitoxin module)
MYSKRLLNKYIDLKLKELQWPASRLAQELSMAPSNLERAMNGETNHFTLQQFSEIVRLLQFTEDQVYHVITGKRSVQATSQQIVSLSERLISELLSENGSKKRSQKKVKN